MHIGTILVRHCSSCTKFNICVRIFFNIRVSLLLLKTRYYVELTL